MRKILDSLLAELNAGVARFCQVGHFVRTDGVTMGFTDHDQTFPFLGIVCKASSA